MSRKCHNITPNNIVIIKQITRYESLTAAAAIYWQKMAVSLPGRLYPSAEAGGGLEDGDGLGLRQLPQVVRRRQATE